MARLRSALYWPHDCRLGGWREVPLKALLLHYWDRLTSSLWFVPAAMAFVAVALASGAVAIDRTWGDRLLGGLDWVYSGGAEGASLLLGTVAGSMISIAGTVFSMTLVALSLASSQLGPRLLRNFMRDSVNQVVLGTFVATFVYCLLVLRTIRRADEGVFVPHLSVSIGVLLAIISMGVLIYFVHHVSVSIQADEVVARVGREIEEGIDRLFPDGVGAPAVADTPALIDADYAAFTARAAFAVNTSTDGYLQLINVEALVDLACREDLLLRLECRPGHFLVKDEPLMMAFPADRLDENLAARINATIVVGNQRTATQDVEFSFHQLVEIALRALSPGINDPFTAVVCVDRIGSALCLLAGRRAPSPHRFDSQGRLRLVLQGSDFPGVVDAAFNQIRQNSHSNPAIAIRMLEAITRVASRIQCREHAHCLRRHAEMIIAGARKSVTESDDLLAVETRFAAVTKSLEQFQR
jgi:uncharacterized membrane protein